MFTPKQRQKLRARLALDQIEAESEIAQQQGSRDFRCSFTEQARRGIEQLVTTSPEEFERRVEEDWAMKKICLQEFLATKPANIFCDRQPMRSDGCYLWNFHEQHDACLVHALVGEKILRLFNLFTVESWNAWACTKYQQDFDKGRSIVAEGEWITNEVIVQSVKDFLFQMQLELGITRIEVLIGDEAGDMVKAAFAMRFADSFRPE
ncbi:MAG TPA: hypothetical protein VLG69_03185 [Candidatus Andersenbacteria bacterium]|nr:hypothetical protein [Candidatus Andersenbacteria bacterium]